MDDSCRATTVRPSISAMTVTIVPAMPISRLRASSGVPWNASGVCTPTLITDNSDPAARAAAADSVGSTHSDPRTYSGKVSRRIILSLLISRIHPAPASPHIRSRPGDGHSLAWPRNFCPEAQRPGHHARIKQVRPKAAQRLQSATGVQAELTADRQGMGADRTGEKERPGHTGGAPQADQRSHWGNLAVDTSSVC